MLAFDGFDSMSSFLIELKTSGELSRSLTMLAVSALDWSRFVLQLLFVFVSNEDELLEEREADEAVDDLRLFRLVPFFLFSSEAVQEWFIWSWFCLSRMYLSCSFRLLKSFWSSETSMRLSLDVVVAVVVVVVEAVVLDCARKPVASKSIVVLSGEWSRTVV